MGESDRPIRWYSTSEMARDAWEVVDHVGWGGGERDVHVVGASMGGMIAMEMVGSSHALRMKKQTWGGMWKVGDLRKLTSIDRISGICPARTDSQSLSGIHSGEIHQLRC